MSTFLGLIKEIPGISIDCFHKKNFNSSIFFLSHCHQDHMKGLTYDFFNYLMKTNKFVYCSSITKLFLKNFFPYLNNNVVNKHLKELPFDDSVIIKYIYNDIHMSITVTCISSGHCPGSVMFLYNVQDKIILYTGDFRINIEDLSKLKSLHYNKNGESVPLNIDKIYLDTTFLNLDYNIFPNRLDSLKELCLTVKNWIEKDSRHIVVLEISSLYGSEFIYIKLSQFLHKKIHVKDMVYKVYKQIQLLANSVTDISESTPIHACMSKMQSIKHVFGLRCRPNIDKKNILTIVLSAMKWIKKDTSCISEWDSTRKQTKNICYSTHASYDEIEAFLMYFKPKQVFACVCNENDQKIYKLLEIILQKIKNNEICNKISHLNFSRYQTFDIENFKSKTCDYNEDNF